jgi:hypothetical protein
MNNKDYWCYQQVDLPKVPTNFVQEALNLAHDNEKNKVENSNDLDTLPVYNRTIYVDGLPVKSRMTPRWDLSEDFSNWIRDNICEEFIDSAVSISIGDSDAVNTGVHTDTKRHYTLIYLLETSNEDQTTAWWQEPGFPVQRSERGYYKESWDSLIPLEKTVFPKLTWVVFNAGILHSIHNIQGSRIAIHISLPYDPFTKENFFKIS